MAMEGYTPKQTRTAEGLNPAISKNVLENEEESADEGINSGCEAITCGTVPLCRCATHYSKAARSDVSGQAGQDGAHTAPPRPTNLFRARSHQSSSHSESAAPPTPAHHQA